MFSLTKEESSARLEETSVTLSSVFIDAMSYAPISMCANSGNVSYCKVAAQLIKTRLISSEAVLSASGLAKFSKPATDAFPLL
jgi:hypothetical protein